MAEIRLEGDDGWASAFQASDAAPAIRMISDVILTGFLKNYVFE
jgi:hypothetical protein